jgi:hypothetical protein
MEIDNMFTMCPFCNTIIEVDKGHVRCYGCSAYGNFNNDFAIVDWHISLHQKTQAYNTENELIKKGWQYHG